MSFQLLNFRSSGAVLLIIVTHTLSHKLQLPDNHTLALTLTSMLNSYPLLTSRTQIPAFQILNLCIFENTRTVLEGRCSAWAEANILPNPKLPVKWYCIPLLTAYWHVWMDCVAWTSVTTLSDGCLFHAPTPRPLPYGCTLRYRQMQSPSHTSRSHHRHYVCTAYWSVPVCICHLPCYSL